MPIAQPRVRREFVLLFVAMLTIGAGNTALQSVMPAIGRSLRVSDNIMAAAFSASALAWVVSAPFWANRSDRTGRRRMVLVGIGGFAGSVLLCGIILTLGLHGAIAPVATIVAFIGARMLYGLFGSAAPPAAQAILALNTSRADRTKALTLLASAFGLGTILGPAVAPFFVFPGVGLAGPAYFFAIIGAVALAVIWRLLPDDTPGDHARGAATSYPSIGSNLTGASVTAAISEATSDRIRITDRRIWPWMLIGLIMGHAQVMAGQAIGFLVIDRMAMPLMIAQQSIGIVLMCGAGAALIVQWGLIPLLNFSPRSLVLAGLAVAAIGCVAIAWADTLYGLATGFGVASAGFGFVRPGYTAGSSLAVGPELQGSVAGRVTSINGASFIIGPSIGVGLYGLGGPIPFLAAGAMCLALLAYAARVLRNGPAAA